MANAAGQAMGEVVQIRDFRRKEEKKPLTDLEKLACELMDVVVPPPGYTAPDKDPA